MCRRTRLGNFTIRAVVGLQNPHARKTAFFPCEVIGKADPSCEEVEPLHERPANPINARQALDYVSNRDPPPGFEHWLEFARENKCHLGSYLRIEKDMEVGSSHPKPPCDATALSVLTDLTPLVASLLSLTQCQNQA